MENKGILGKRARELDQFLTKRNVADLCVRNLIQKLDKMDLEQPLYVFEPSAGKGAFVEAAESQKVAVSDWIDVDACDESRRKDFLQWSKPALHDAKPSIILGNPPFGKKSSIAVRFFNHAAKYFDVIAFIVPLTFRKVSVLNCLDNKFRQLVEFRIEENGFEFEEKEYNVPCIFTIWIRIDKWDMWTGSPICPEHKRPKETTSDFNFIRKQELSYFSIRRNGVNAGKIFTDKADGRSSNSYVFIDVAKDVDPEKVLACMKSANLMQLNNRFNTAGSPSLTQQDIIGAYNACQKTNKN